MTLLVKIQSKTFSDEALNVYASVEAPSGTYIGAYLLDLSEDASDADVVAAIQAAYAKAVKG